MYLLHTFPSYALMKYTAHNKKILLNGLMLMALFAVVITKHTAQAQSHTINWRTTNQYTDHLLPSFTDAVHSAHHQSAAHG